MRNILTICQEAINELGFDLPGSITGSGDLARQLRTIANTVGAALLIRKNWEVLTEEMTFTTVAAEEQINLLTDLPYHSKIIPDTMFNRTQQKRIRGSLTAQAWQRMKADGVSPADHFFRVRGGKIYFATAPEAGETVAFEYIDKRFAATAAGAAKEFFTLDTDIPRLDDQLFVLGIRWRFCKEKGFSYGEAFREWEDLIEHRAGNDTPDEILSLNPCGRGSYELADGYVPEGSWNTN